MTEELRKLLRSELGAERPPPLGDLVDTAVRDGRRIRRVRRFAVAGGGTAVAGVVALAVALSGTLAAPAPRSAPPPAQAGDVAPPAASPLPVFPEPATAQLGPVSPVKPNGKPAPATPEAMLVLLRELLPPGRTSDYAKAAGGDLHVQMFLDQGSGPGMVRVSISGFPRPGGGPTRLGRPKISVEKLPDNCIQSLTVDALFPDGTDVRADVASCLAWNGVTNTAATRPLTEGQASKLVANPGWGLTMDASLVLAGGTMFHDVPTFG
ncbi:MAG TPA: hypothetical protein VGP57_02970 [Actinoplanes sp.]|jgi:hypothetical protein|nr:hypothetical protein [Actinoplanes sp.]